MESNERVTLVPINTTLAAEPQQPTKRSENNKARPGFIALKAMDRRTLISEREKGDDGDWNGERLGFIKYQWKHQLPFLRRKISVSLIRWEINSRWLKFAYSHNNMETMKKKYIYNDNDNDKFINRAKYYL